MDIVAKEVMVLGCPAGNLWDIYKGDVFACRVTYHGNKLHKVRQGQIVVSVKDIEAAIETIYA